VNATRGGQYSSPRTALHGDDQIVEWIGETSATFGLLWGDPGRPQLPRRRSTTYSGASSPCESYTRNLAIGVEFCRSCWPATGGRHPSDRPRRAHRRADWYPGRRAGPRYTGTRPVRRGSRSYGRRATRPASPDPAAGRQWRSSPSGA
jgi:hypothetical protein